ncbi:MAG: hypothetical protein JNJ85_01615 [Candidatus Kapabacteria bacterium]|nr:hypothetical protein [Candidatus Kapabacteria bacterium]
MKHFLSVLLVCVCLCSVVSVAQNYAPFNAEQLQVIMPSSTRYVTSLAGSWERSTDGNEWTAVTLPMSESYPGSVTYRRKLQIDGQLVQRYMWNLYFLGVSDAVEVTINGRLVGKFFCGMVPHMVRIPDKFIRAGANDIQLMVYPASDDAQRSRILDLFGQRAYGGVIREVLLVGTPQVMVQDVRSGVQLINGVAKVTISSNITAGTLDKVTVDSTQTISLTKAQLTVLTEIRKQETGEIAATASQAFTTEHDRSFDAKFVMDITNPTLWSPSDPSLYSLTVKVMVNGQTIDEYTAPLGLTSVQEGSMASQSWLTVNGQSIFIKGVDYVEEAPGGSATVSAQQMERDVQLLKTLGVNLVRVKFFAPNPYFMYLCMKYGILVVVDMPCYNIPANILGGEEVMARMKNIANLMLSAYERYSSLVAWNICEGLQQDKSETYLYVKTIADLFHASSSRLVSTAVRFRSKTVVTDNVDVHIFIEDKFVTTPEEIANELTRLSQIAAKPFALVFGKPIQPDNRSGYSDPISVESQARFIQTCCQGIKNTPAGGTIVWSLTDYSLNRSIMLTNTSGGHSCYSGLADINRQPRLAFEMYKAWINNENDPLLQPGNYSIASPYIYIVCGLLLIIVVIVMMNQSRRFREYLLRALIHPYNFYADIRDQRILSQAQTVALAAIISAIIGVILSTLLFHSRMSPVSEYMVMLLFPQESMKSFVSAIAWSPELGVTVITLFVVLNIIIVSLLLRLSAIFVRARIYFSDTFIITVWSALPVVLFLPFATVLYRALDFTAVSLWLGFGLIVTLWVIYRLLRATSVVFDVNPIPVYGIGLLVIGGFFFIIGLSYNITYAFYAYIKFFFNVIV